MEFKEFNELMQVHVSNMSGGESHLFETDVSKDELWHMYLESFPPGMNEVFRERREFDCNHCRQFIRSLGNVVAIQGARMISVWDLRVGNDKYQPVVDTLSQLVKSRPIRNVFVSDTRAFGTYCSREQIGDEVHTWHHLQANIFNSVVIYKTAEKGKMGGEFRSTRDVLKRSLEELSVDSVDTVLELIAQKSLYKGEEWKNVLEGFRNLQRQYRELEEGERDLYCWKTSVSVGQAISRIRNHSIGVLLQDISAEVELDEAVKRYEKIVAPSNYKRPKAVFTKRMVEQAAKTVRGLGLEASLGRRFAILDEIKVSNVLFANRDAVKRMQGDVFTELAELVPGKPKNLDKVEEVPIDTFVQDVLPGVKEIEVYLENRHMPNMVSLIAPKDRESPSLFKWSNGFSWAYSGNITDSMKQRVKAAGGRVDGVLRFSIQWNEHDDNLDDLDAHCREPDGFHIYFQDKDNRPTGGNLDVDIINPQGVAVENITWPSLDRMRDGTYKFWVHDYSHRGGRSGFDAEIEFGGKLFSFSHPDPLRQGENILVAEVTLKNGEFSIRENLPSSVSSQDAWGVPTESFHSVSSLMYSPNYWDGQLGIGHRHFFFMLNGCRNPESPNGFFNEFLMEEFMEHKRVFEALGSKMRVEDAEDQLSGLGFSATKRASLVCKVKGSFTRVIKLVF